VRERDTKTTAGGTFHYKGQCWHMTAQEDRDVPMENSVNVTKTNVEQQ
jgi:hypothetical protein